MRSTEHRRKPTWKTQYMRLWWYCPSAIWPIGVEMLSPDTTTSSKIVIITTSMMETDLFTDYHDVTTTSNISAENTTQRQLPAPFWTDQHTIVWLVFATVVSIVGNAAIVWIVVATPTLRSTPHNRLVVQLAICDLLTAMFNAPPIAAAMIFGHWPFDGPSCQLHGASTTLFGIASVITLAVISLNRSAMVVKRLQASVYSRSFPGTGWIRILEN